MSGTDRPGTGRFHAGRRSTTLTGLLGLVVVLALLATAPAAPAADLLARWPLDEGAGQVAADVSGRGHHARLGRFAGADQNDPAWVSGRFGSALRFVGAENQFAEFRRPSVLAPGAITVEAWVRRLSTPGQFRYVVSSGARGCEFSSFGLYTGSGDGLAFYVSHADGYVVSPSAAPTSVWDGGWHHAAGTYDGRNVRLYLDGIEVGQGSPAGFSIFYGLASPGAFIGTYRGTCELPFTGDVDEISIRDRALGAAEIAAVAQRALERPEPPQAPPVTGPPAVGHGGPATPADPPRKRCFALRVRPGRLVVRRRTRLRIA
ncbi:MAG: LamG domain-containing protein, partial [Gammaproteobacteria bacterium]